MKFVASCEKINLPAELSIEAGVGIGADTERVWYRSDAENRGAGNAAFRCRVFLVQKAHLVCPYSKTRNA